MDTYGNVNEKVANNGKKTQLCSFRAPAYRDPGVFCTFWPQIRILRAENHNTWHLLSNSPLVSEKKDDSVIWTVISMLNTGPRRPYVALRGPNDQNKVQKYQEHM